jgi:multidrug resistance efflux pump
LDLAISKARVDKARADVSLMRARVSHCTITAPFKGRVAKVVAKPYETVRQGQPLLEILDDSELKMQLYVPSKWLLWLSPGVKFRISIDETGKSYSALITTIGARVDPVSQTLAVNAMITGKHTELLAGMSGVAKFTVPQ